MLVGTGIIIIILLILLFMRGASTPPAPPPAPKAEAPAPAPPAPATAPAAPAATHLKGQLQEVLGSLREAQLNKDIVKFMSVYSLTFPELDNKRTKTLKSWEKYDFTNLVFTIDQIQTIDLDNAIVQVTWYLDIRNRKTQELSSTTQAYQVRFSKELGKWRIRALEEVEE